MNHWGPRPVGTKGFWFGDPRRPRSLALAFVFLIATFPVFWGGLVILYALGDGDTTGNAESGLVWFAAIPVAIGLFVAYLLWLEARRSYPPAELGTLRGREAVLSTAAVLAVLGVAVALGIWMWNVDF